jgi:hypothetical protein
MILPISDTISCQEYDIHYVLMLSVLNPVSCKFLLGDMQGQSTKVDDIGLPGYCSAVIAYISNLDLTPAVKVIDCRHPGPAFSKIHLPTWILNDQPDFRSHDLRHIPAHHDNTPVTSTSMR